MKNVNYMNMLKRVAVYCLGLFLLGIGVSFSVKSDLGVSPVNSLPYVVSLVTGVEQGKCVTIVFCCYIGLQFLMLGKNFKPVYLLQIIAATVFGKFVTLANIVTVGIPACTNYPMRLVYLVISMVIVAIGVDLYVKAEIISLPTEGVMEAMVKRFGMTFPNAKTTFDTAVVVVSAAVSLIAFHGLNGVREGTIIAAIGIGQLVKAWRKYTTYEITEFLKK